MTTKRYLTSSATYALARLKKKKGPNCGELWKSIKNRAGQDVIAYFTACKT